MKKTPGHRLYSMKSLLLLLSGWLILFIALGLVTRQVLAAAFYIPEVGSPASLGTAGVANVTNTVGPATAWSNPAGMTGLDRDQALAGFQVVVPRLKFDSSVATAGGRDGGNAGNTAVIPGLFYVNKFNARTRLGISLVAPQGGGVNYGDDFVGRYQTSRAELAAIGVSPSIGFKVNDRFSIGAGVSIIYTKFEQTIAINQTNLVPGAPDGKVRFDNATDLGYQPFLGLTWQFTDRALLGVVYRAEMDVDLEGDVNFRNLVIPTPAVKDVDIGWDNPQWLEAGVKYKLSEWDNLYVNAGWQDWSAFSKNQLAFTGGTVATLDRQWDDTWQAGIAYSHLKGDVSGYSVGASYESSPVKDRLRTFDLPVDEFYKLSGSWFWRGNKSMSYAVGATLYMVDDAKIDLTEQGVRAAGKFDSNYILFVGGTVRYLF